MQCENFVTREEFQQMKKTGRKEKYHRRKVTVDGITFDSVKEADRYGELQVLEKAGKISGLERQKRFVLIPAQRGDGKIVERACTYTADFCYWENGEHVVEDCKGVKTEVYRIKKKLMLFVHGIRIRET